MKYMIKILAVALCMGLLSACSWENVPPTAKGKILTTSGYTDDILVPGKYTLWGRDEMILLQTNTNTFREQVKVILQDKLTLVVDVRFRGRIAGTDAAINAMFNDIVPGPDMMVEFLEVYNVYGKMAVRNKTREIISQYSVEDVHKNYARLSGEIAQVLSAALAKTPLQISDIALGDIAYPPVVTKAVELAKERELAIKKEENQAIIDLTRKKNEKLLAEANYQVKMANARAIRDSNKTIGEGVTPALIELRRLEVLEKMAENKSAVFMPVEGMSSVGAQVRMYQK